MSITIAGQEIRIPLGKVELSGIMMVPENATSIVIFSQSVESSRYSTRNNFVAEILQNRGFATLLFDPLTEEEDQEPENRSNIDLLTKRLEYVLEWIGINPATKELKIGLYGTSRGATSEMRVAAIMEDKVHAVVCRGGMPELSNELLEIIKAPTLLIVGELDQNGIELNRNIYEQLNCIKAVQIIDGATHLFNEPGKLEKVAWFAIEWFETHLSKITAKYEY
ncbi:MAG: dienelactone hydrolase family protein [Bacteroidia bacterium]|nr:dienelactone hydrolase family protein [Bacteroidia bacterium]